MEIWTKLWKWSETSKNLIKKFLLIKNLIENFDGKYENFSHIFKRFENFDSKHEFYLNKIWECQKKAMR